MTPPVEDQIVASIMAAISEQRLPAGTQLVEQELSELFGCNRANVRRALASLAALHVVELRPHRGAFVSSPSPKEARDVFEARGAIERTIARQAAGKATPADIKALRENIEAEIRAHEAGLQPEELRLSRFFHLEIARIAGNAVLERMLSELTMRTTLIIGLYGRPHQASCAKEDHGAIVDALEQGDSQKLVEMMDKHLHHLESDVEFCQRKPTPSSLRTQLFSD